MPKGIDETDNQPSSGLSTKEKIFNAAVKMMSEGGYHAVSTRDIAKALGIRSASIYNHYASKEELLHSMYDYYTAHWNEKCPKKEMLLELVETAASPYEVFAAFDFRFDADKQYNMDCIIKIAAMNINTDARSAKLIKDHAFATDTTIAVLNRLIELEKIEYLDVDGFAAMLSMMNIGSALVNGTGLQIELSQWQAALGMLFSLVKAKGNTAGKDEGAI